MLGNVDHGPISPHPLPKKIGMNVMQSISGLSKHILTLLVVEFARQLNTAFYK
jgi:hypothetical protein